MKTILLGLTGALVLSVGCKKKEKTNPVINITYEVQSNAPQVKISYTGKVIRENGGSSPSYNTWEIASPGTHTKTVEVEKGQYIEFHGLSSTSGDYKLLLKDAAGNVIQQVDTMAFYPANQYHGDQYVTRIIIANI